MQENADTLEAPGDITFTEPDYGNQDDGTSRRSSDRHEHVTFQEPVSAIDQERDISDVGPRTESTQDESGLRKPTSSETATDDDVKHSSNDVNGVPEIVVNMYDSNRGRVSEDREPEIDLDALQYLQETHDSVATEQNSDGMEKGDMLTPTRSLSRAATEPDVHDVEAKKVQKVAKKKTYLHRNSKMYRERMRKHTALAKMLDVFENIWTMFSTFPYWDMAFWSGYVLENVIMETRLLTNICQVRVRCRISDVHH